MDTEYWLRYYEMVERERAMMERETARQSQKRATPSSNAHILEAGVYSGLYYDYAPGVEPPAVSPSPQKQFKILKKSVKTIEVKPFNGKERKRIETKINRLQGAGAVAQATILEQELKTRDSLVHLKEWDYKILTKEAIDKFQADNTMTLTRDGLKVHIDPLEKYCGNPEKGEAKDRIIPDGVLDKLETAKERQLFDEFAVLWVEKVKDPLLLGVVHGCEDYFFVTEWGNDVSFKQITKGE